MTKTRALANDLNDIVRVVCLQLNAAPKYDDKLKATVSPERTEKAAYWAVEHELELHDLRATGEQIWKTVARICTACRIPLEASASYMTKETQTVNTTTTKYTAKAHDLSIISVNAVSPDDARAQIELELSKPGRSAYLSAWRAAGSTLETAPASEPQPETLAEVTERAERLTAALKTVTHELAMQLALRFNVELAEAERNETVKFARRVITADGSDVPAVKMDNA